MDQKIQNLGYVVQHRDGFIKPFPGHEKAKITVLIPAHNEQARIGSTLENYMKYFNGAEILVEMDGCRDGTLDIVKKFSENGNTNNNVLRYLHYKEKLGKGGGLIRGIQHAKGDIIAIADADGSTSPQEISRLINNLNGCAGVIGSRWLPGSVVPVKQPLQRQIASRGFNFLVRCLLGLPYRDTQCGAKVFKKEAVMNVIDEVKISNFAFDVDLLYQLNKRGYKVYESPITWQDKNGSSLKLFRTTIIMFLAIFRLRLVNSPFRYIVRNRLFGHLYDRMLGKKNEDPHF